jgi:hypothetical protein
MTKNWVKDIETMHARYNVKEKVKNLSPEILREFLKFRINFLAEELNELDVAVKSDPIDAEETVDALIDLCVVAIGTLDLFDVDAHKAWQEVYKANMNKEVGIKASRPNPFSLPDLIKPTGWQAPSHAGNHGLFSQL